LREKVISLGIQLAAGFAFSHARVGGIDMPKRARIFKTHPCTIFHKTVSRTLL
jgi:hypothetical protein